MSYMLSVHWMFLKIAAAGYGVQTQFRQNGWVVVTLIDKHTHDIYLHRAEDGTGHIFEFKSIMNGSNQTEMEGAWANCMRRLYDSGVLFKLWKRGKF